MANYYRLRITTASGSFVSSSKHFKLSRTVDDLESLTGLVVSYQVVHRHLKSSPVWAFGWFPSRSVVDDLLGCYQYPALVATIVDLGPDGVEELLPV
jgi:hypothetical protein